MHHFFKKIFILTLLLAFATAVPAQTTPRKPTAKKPAASTRSTAAKPKATPARTKAKATATPVDPAVEKERFDTAINTEKASEKAELLIKFLVDFPNSENKLRAQESLAGTRAAMADELLSAGETAQAVRLFKLAIEEAPKPYSERLLGSVIATIPANLYWRGHRAEGLELARLIETHVNTNARQLAALTTFYLGIEDGAEAKRIAEAAVKLDENNAAAHQALAMAERLNFDLEASEKSFAKALELTPDSIPAKRSLAEMKRATGKSQEAVTLFQEIVAKDENDTQARTGLILALFESGKKAEAETELATSLEKNPGNVVLLGGAAYWYAANGDGDKAVDHARRAIEKEPRYIWSHIALARGLMLQKKPVEAEQALVNARQYGNFPTLQYEIASARLAAGFFREAAEELKKGFELADGSIETKLGGRIERSGASFTDLLAAERRASIFAPVAADSAENADRLRSLLELDTALSNEKPNDADAASAADKFANGTDNMSIHRKLYAANALMDKNVGTDAALEMARSAASMGADKSLDVANPGAAVMASELYEARAVTFARNDFLLIPDVPKQTLSALMRGRLEDTQGQALLKQGKGEEAETRFRRALTVFPKDSAWWRGATWNLGLALEAQGKDKDALDSMIASYTIDRPNTFRYFRIEDLYRKVNGNLDGLEAKVGKNPMPTLTMTGNKETPAPTPEASPTVAPESVSVIETKSETKEEPKPSPSPEEVKEEAKPSPSPEEVKEEAKPSPSPDEVKEDPKPTPSPEETKEEPKPSPSPEAEKKPGQLFAPIIISVPPPVKPKVTNEESISTGAARPRVVEGKEITGSEPPPPCVIGFSQENVSLINNGGSLAVIVSYEGEASALKAISSSPKDIEVRLEPDIAEVKGRALFVVKSITAATGVFQITFELPCGKKELIVNVR